jgi:hypothetical protein
VAESEAFLGVKPEALAALGKIVVAAGRVEMVLAYVANEIGVIDPTGPASTVIKDIKKAVRASLPAPFERLCPDVLDWMARLHKPLEIRHQAIHGVHMRLPDVGGEGDAVAFLMRKEEHLVVRVEELEAAAEMLAVLCTEGMHLVGALRMANLSLKKQPPRPN